MKKEPTVSLVPEKPGHLFTGVRPGVRSAAVGISKHTSQEGRTAIALHT